MNSVISDGVRGYTASVDSKGNVSAKTVRAPLTVSSHIGASVSVGTSSAELVAATTGRRALYLCNTGSQAVYLRFGTGTASVTDFKLGAGEKFAFENAPDEALTAISEGGGSSVAVIEVKV